MLLLSRASIVSDLQSQVVAERESRGQLVQASVSDAINRVEHQAYVARFARARTGDRNERSGGREKYCNNCDSYGHMRSDCRENCCTRWCNAAPGAEHKRWCRNRWLTDDDYAAQKRDRRAASASTSGTREPRRESSSACLRAHHRR